MQTILKGFVRVVDLHGGAVEVVPQNWVYRGVVPTSLAIRIIKPTSRPSVELPVNEQE